MSIEFVWSIDSLDVNPSDGDRKDVVLCCIWSCIAKDGERSFSVGSKNRFSAPGDSFIEFEKLTEPDVLGWVWANGIDKAAVEQTAAAGLRRASVVRPAPWKAAQDPTPEMEAVDRPWL